LLEGKINVQVGEMKSEHIMPNHRLVYNSKIISMILPKLMQNIGAFGKMAFWHSETNRSKMYLNA